MIIHELTTEQVRKFLDAVGANKLKIAEEVLRSGRFTTDRLKTMADFAGGLQDWPKITDDPLVNYVVDCVVVGEDDPYDEQLYAGEVNAFKELEARHATA